MSVTRFITAVGVALLLATLAPAVARADDKDDPRALYERGQDLYRAGDYKLAADYFLRAHDLLPTPEFLFNAAQAYRLDENCERSATLYRQFLADEPSHPERDLIERHLVDMDRCASWQRAALEQARLDPASQPTSAGDKRSDTFAWVLTGVGAGLLTTSGFLALDSKRASDDVSRIFAEGEAWSPTADAIARRGKRSETLAWAAGTIGAGCLAAATYLLVRDSDESEPAPSSPGLSFTEGGAVAGWSWRY